MLPDASLTVGSGPQVHSFLMFYSDGPEPEEIGRLSWDKGKLVFSGNAEESARVFFRFLSSYVEERIRNAA